MKQNFGFEYTDPDTIDALKKAEYPRLTITGTPWYNVLSNPQYINNFCFVPSYVGEREKIINDGFEEAESEVEKKYKCEQSDMVMILLQLAYIPDVVIQDVNFTEAGWSYKFKERMEQYKQDFEKEHHEKWTFQDEFTEERYKNFKEQIDEQEGGFSHRTLSSAEMDQITKKNSNYEVKTANSFAIN